MVSIALVTPRDALRQAADRVESALQAFGPYRFAKVAVHLQQGRIALTGSVPSFYAKSLAYQISSRIAREFDVVDAVLVSISRPPVATVDSAV